MKARRVCGTVGCPHLAVEGGTRCPRCMAAWQQREEERQRRNMAEYDRNRPNAQVRGYGAKHRAWRDQVLARDKVCQGWPHLSGCGQPTTVADHIVPKSEGGRAFDLRNGRGMCDTCHNRKRQEESTRAKARKRHNHGR